MSAHILNGIPEDRLSAEQESALAGGGSDAQADLVLYNLREAYHYARGCYQSNGLAEGEVLSACYDGLSQAARNFKPAKIRFFSYAKAYLRGCLSRAQKSHDVVRRSGGTESLPPESAANDDDDSSTELPPVVRKPAELPPHEVLDFDGVFCREEFSQLRPLLFEVLDDRERLVLELNFLGGLNLQEIAGLLAISRERVRINKRSALRKLRVRLKGFSHAM